MRNEIEQSELAGAEKIDVRLLFTAMLTGDYTPWTAPPAGV